MRVLAATSDVTLGRVRRNALDEHGEPIPSHDGKSRVSEMALYVLVRREKRGGWGGGQNTMINIDRGAAKQ